MSKTKQTLMVIDGHSLAFRAFYALPPESFKTGAGQHTNAIHGFISMLLSLVQKENPTHLAVAFDPPGPTFRHEVYPEYKGNRSETPEEFKGQVELLAETLELIGIRTISIPTFEADDVLATLGRLGTEADYEVLLVSGDRDTIQLINDNTTILYPIKGVSTLTRFNDVTVFERYGITPKQYPDQAALVGEDSDNIPGVPGVGPKTAAKWLTKYGNLEEILEHSEEITGKVGENLRAHLEQVRKNRELNALLTTVELGVELEALERVTPESSAIEDSFDRLEFRTLKDRAKKILASTQGDIEEPGTATLSLATVSEKEAFTWFNETAEKAETLTLWIERDYGSGFNVAIAKAEQVYAANRPELSPEILEWLSDPLAKKQVFDAKAVQAIALEAGFSVAGIVFDANLVFWLQNPTKPAKDFSELVYKTLTVEIPQPDVNQLLPETNETDLGTLVSLLQQACASLIQTMDDQTAGVLTRIDLPLTSVLAKLEHVGISVDRPLLLELEHEFETRIARIEKAAFASIGREVNLSSPKQLQDVLYTQLELKPLKATKTGFSTNAETIQDLAETSDHPFLGLLLEHRDNNKLKQITQTLLKSVSADTRIHTTLQQTGTATGRISSLEPNLQNIPVRSAEGRRLRAVFTHGEQYETLLTADYSQIEMRIMAHLSGDEGLIHAFNEGEDLHRFVGAQIFHVEPSDVTSDMRSQVKAMSYGLVYGLSAFGLSRQLRIDVGQAKALMTGYFDRFGKVRDYLRNVVEEARAIGYTETIFGRRRYFPELQSSNRLVVQSAERAALNAPIQGSAADIIKLAMLEIDRKFIESQLESRLLLQVHDELICEVYPGEIDQAKSILTESMQSAAELSVPLDVQVGIGANWDAAAH